MSVNSTVFGTLKPPSWLHALISLAHLFRSRLLASIARRLALKRPLPMDITVGDINLRCRFYDNYSERKFVFTPWRYDLRERRLLEQVLPEDGVFVDIGANIGLYTLTANKSLGNGGRILAFEPNPATLQRLDFNVQANQKSEEARPTIVQLNLGVADQDSSFELWPDKSNLGGYSIRKDGRARSSEHQSSGQSIVIHCRPLLDVLKEQQVEHIDVLKIDIEGAEDLALGPYLEQAPDSLLAKTIIIENSEALWDCDLFGMMRQRGYHFCFSSKWNSVFSLSRVNNAEWKKGTFE